MLVGTRPHDPCGSLLLAPRVPVPTTRATILTTDALPTEAAPAAATEDAPTEATPTTTPTFGALGVLPAIEQALAQVGITKPFPIQAMAIPIALTGTDMIGQARTGTGKTLAFGVAVLQRSVMAGERDYAQLAKPGAPQALVVTPTRELASQVSADLAVASTLRHARVLTVYGGVGYEPQLSALARGVEVVVGTPGRLLDLVDRGALDLGHVKVLVLDEADEMLDLGFLPDVERILARTPELRQTMLFSATMPSAIVTLARRHLRHPVNIRAESAEDTMMVPATAQFVYQAHDLDKPEIVARILQAENRNRVMIFSRTKRSAQRLADDLADRGFAVASIHGDLNQALREKALKRFREGKINVLVATDVAARGIDVEGITHVINYECPDDDKTYVHRIGRTGRAGASGIAVTFVDWADQTRWKVINSTLGLPFEEPEETYSTSAHLFHDLGIDPAARGRITPAKPARSTEDDEERKARRADRPKKRSRRRLRNGVPVGSAETADRPAQAEATSLPESATPKASAENQVAATEEAGGRRRRRRRSRPTDRGPHPRVDERPSA
jgi:superfamily II DNA/RNA helicase